MIRTVTAVLMFGVLAVIVLSMISPRCHSPMSPAATAIGFADMMQTLGSDLQANNLK